jgi:hypothetical protein
MAELDDLHGRAELVFIVVEELIPLLVNPRRSNATGVGCQVSLPFVTSVGHGVRQRVHKPTDKPFRKTTAPLPWGLRDFGISHANQARINRKHVITAAAQSPAPQEARRRSVDVDALN